MAKKTSKTHLERVVRRGRVGAVEVPLAGGVADVLEVEVDALVAVLGHHGSARPARQVHRTGVLSVTLGFVLVMISLCVNEHTQQDGRRTCGWSGTRRGTTVY
jgi:hypothetical protein